MGAALVAASIISLFAIFFWFLLSLCGLIYVAYKRSPGSQKFGQDWQLTRKYLAVAFYIFAIPCYTVLLLMFWSFGDEVKVYLLLCERIMVMFTVFLLFCWLLPKLMVNSTKSVHLHASAVLAILAYPVYYHLLIKIGFFDAFYGAFLSYMEAHDRIPLS